MEEPEPAHGSPTEGALNRDTENRLPSPCPTGSSRGGRAGSAEVPGAPVGTEGAGAPGATCTRALAGTRAVCRAQAAAPRQWPAVPSPQPRAPAAPAQSPAPTIPYLTLGVSAAVPGGLRAQTCPHQARASLWPWHLGTLAPERGRLRPSPTPLSGLRPGQEQMSGVDMRPPPPRPGRHENEGPRLLLPVRSHRPRERPDDGPPACGRGHQGYRCGRGT